MRFPFLPNRVVGLGAATGALLLVLAGCSDTTTTEPTPTAAKGSITITAATTGTDPDPNGYTVSLDGTSRGTVAINGTLAVDSVAAGDHQITLAGVAQNCTADNAGPRTVTVTSGQATGVTFNVACVANVGTVQIITSTDGLVLDPDGYAVVFKTDTVAVGVNDTTTMELAPGALNLKLIDQAANCTPHGLPTASGAIAFGDTTSVTFALTCFQDPIVFERQQPSGRNDLYVVDASGGTEVRLTDDPSQYNSFLGSPTSGSAWNPGKTAIAYQSSSESDFTEIDVYVMALNKSAMHHLVQTAPQFAPRWSLDGSKVLFSSYTSVSGGWTANIWTANADLTGATNLSPTDAWDNAASWSPDGTKIVFARDSGQIGGSSASILVMDTDGSNKVNVSDPGAARAATAWDGSPTWSPDGTRIAFARFDYSGASGQTGDIWAVDADGSNLVQLTKTTPQESNPFWSPDGTKIYFTRCGEADCTSQDVWVMDADGSNATQVTTSGGDFLGDWNATTTFAGSVTAGTAMVTTDMDLTNFVGRVFMQAPDGSSRVALTAAGLDAENPHWR